MTDHRSNHREAGPFELVVMCWGGDAWQVYMRRKGIRTREQAELLGQEEVSRVLFRTSFRVVMFVVRNEEDLMRNGNFCGGH